MIPPTTTVPQRLPARLRYGLLAVITALLIQGCGFKGELYLPEEGEPAKPGKSRQTPPPQ